MRLGLWLLLAAGWAAGCSSFSTGSTSSNPVEDGGGGGGSAADASDRAVLDASQPADDGGGVTIAAGQAWTSPNGATWVTTDHGTAITRASMSFNHPVLLAAAPFALPADDYTIHATIVAMTSTASSGGRTELGLVFRGEGAGDDMVASVFGTDYGGQGLPFLADISAADWNPNAATVTKARSAFPVMLGARYHLAVEVNGTREQAKIWEDSTPEPGWQLSRTTVRSSGRLVGVYSYFATDAVFESLTVTVP